ncbi:hypothetical protein BUY33_09435 [Staphylococcus cohnii]|nr:hypothetical protein BUY26_11920 [Staphylococcus cohnii]RIL83472.1 hypothetical protein BUY33_09435 [Staphylococcus cohnii]
MNKQAYYSEENIEYIEGKPYIQYGTKYGELGAGFIEIHHIKPMFSIKQEVSKNPEKDKG